MALKSVDEFQLSPRITLKPGDRVRLTGGGGDIGERLPGNWRIVSILKRGKRRTYFNVTNYTYHKGKGGLYTVFVDGPPYRRLGIMWRPYGVKRVS